MNHQEAMAASMVAVFNIQGVLAQRSRDGELLGDPLPVVVQTDKEQVDEYGQVTGTYTVVSFRAIASPPPLSKDVVDVQQGPFAGRRYELADPVGDDGYSKSFYVREI